MAGITSMRCSVMGALVLVLCVLAQASLSSAHPFDFKVSLTTPPLPQVSLPEFPPLPHLSFPPLSLPKRPRFSVAPRPSKVTIPGFKFSGFSIPPEQALEAFRFPTFPPQSGSLPRFPGISLPAETFLPPLPSLRFPGFSYPPTPAKPSTAPEFNPADLTIPSYTFRTVAVPPTSFPFPRRALPRSYAQVKN